MTLTCAAKNATLVSVTSESVGIIHNSVTHTNSQAHIVLKDSVEVEV